MVDQVRMMQDFLSTASPEEWFFVATNTNYDDKELLNWIVEQPACPRAAAHAVYWAMGPGYYTKFKSIEEVSDWAKPTYQLLRDIEDRLEQDFYRVSDIGFNPTADAMREIDWLKEYPESPEGHQIPDVMKASTPGRKLSRDDVPEGWDEGMPPHIVDAVWNK